MKNYFRNIGMALRGLGCAFAVVAINVANVVLSALTLIVVGAAFALAKIRER